MSLAVASALIHGFKDTQPIKIDEKLAGFLLISPWVSYSTDAKSWKENAEKDVVPAVIQDVLADAYVGKNARDEYSEPLRADTSWWRDIPAKSVLNVYGGAECFRDDIRELGKKLEDAGNPVQNVECAKQVHIDCVLDAQSEMEPGEMSHEIWKWLASLV